MSYKQVISAAERNKEPILQVLKNFLSPYIQATSKEDCIYHCLEISSGTGQHVAYFAPHFPSVVWQPSDVDMSSFCSISAYIQDAQVSNIKQPIYIDVSDEYTKWGGGGVIGKHSMDFILNINLLHISPFRCTEGLFHNTGQVLKHGGLLITYGPYAFHGKISPASNVRFNSMLQSQNPEWGLRDIDQLATLAASAGIHLLEVVPLPSNNHCLIWKKE
ncbi:Methyltransferase-like 26 [Cryptotermes secundus]|uniref:Methyltransferase-like 26 n=2 Tax=Cryptotermes secundus TaxID=105785 RepID=A0A2J7Q1P9_9NEOP|nr:methyltransferase-like 26 isoform X3 [Cryptotermes secundus]XP_023718456.1 methyltransferase-like 26 isoform X3 [Cryptotermes secundus]XP_023718457.1 methyltransferase-like 26 isoform X3 [Cryptotermes secundus]XP_023718458.1 methyltransferase-like 26 isoform X3 [Cryptotermes secundus]PNF22515.1 Methyltransferase-like 26 [Cryptotermes secundus]